MKFRRKKQIKFGLPHANRFFRYQILLEFEKSAEKIKCFKMDEEICS